VASGVVRFFDAQKYSSIAGAGYRSLEQGQQVEFEIGPGRKGDEAQNVRVI